MKLTHGQEIARSRILGSPRTIITGDRQSGKSTLVLDVADQWLKSNDSSGSLDHIMVVSHNHSASIQLSDRFIKSASDHDKNSFIQFGSVKRLLDDVRYIAGRKRVGILIDEAGYITNWDANKALAAFAQHPNVTKFSMISTPGPGQFFSEILETCVNHGPWLRPLFVHHELECTDMDREYFRNTLYCRDSELLELFAQQHDINQRIQRILTK